MTIDFGSEHLLSLTDAAKQLPRRRAGRKPHISTLYRWALRGLKGVKLETVQVGGTTCTSVEALQRFFDSLCRRPDDSSLASKSPTHDRCIETAETFLKNDKF
jgi:hypothetical protein